MGRAVGVCKLTLCIFFPRVKPKSSEPYRKERTICGLNGLKVINNLTSSSFQDSIVLCLARVECSQSVTRGWGGGGGRERHRQTQRVTHTQRHTETDRQTHRQTARQAGRQASRDRDKGRQRQRGKDRDTQRDTETETQRETEREKDRETETERDIQRDRETETGRMRWDLEILKALVEVPQHQ